jgi:hypothetical protein
MNWLLRGGRMKCGKQAYDWSSDNLSRFCDQDDEVE